MGKSTTIGMIAILAGLLAVAAPVLANNLALTNTHLRAPAAGKVEVGFDISWDNAWRDGVNWDAAWVFVKYSVDGGGAWSHATLGGSGTNPAGFSGGTGANLEVVVPADKKGAFIQRSANGMGTISNTGVKLVWDFATNGVSRSKSALIKVFAIEMVYIPEGAFWAGNTNGVIQSSFRHKDDANSPVYIDSTNAFDIYWGTGVGAKATVPNTFPNGYGAFYLMKTEISQRQYCDFLNTLTANQQGNRHYANLYFGSFRNFIKKTDGSPAVFGCDANNNAGTPAAVTNVANLNEIKDGEWVACNYLSWMDGAAYADWAALRPFTELEYEKACRGPLAPVENEHAWGDATLEALTLSLVNVNTASEAPDQGNCNIGDVCSSRGPYRCGSYARSSSGRANAGAGYYGVLDLSGNLLERPVTVGNVTGLAFTGLHGDGDLSAGGYANVTNWPGLDVYAEVTGAAGTGSRGGEWLRGFFYARVADRSSAASVAAGRILESGWRGARSAPSGLPAAP